MDGPCPIDYIYERPGALLGMKKRIAPIAARSEANAITCQIFRLPLECDDLPNRQTREILFLWIGPCFLIDKCFYEFPVALRPWLSSSRAIMSVQQIQRNNKFCGYVN